MVDGCPLVSVIIPVHNRASQVCRAIDSVLAQTLDDFELIVVDDASTDQTEDVVRSVTDPRIQYLKHDTNQGAATARNTGVHASSGEYVSFLDSDDQWAPRRLELAVDVFEQQKDIGLVYGGWQWVQEDTMTVVTTRIPDEKGTFDGLPRWVFDQSNDFLVRRDIILDQPFGDAVFTYEHIDFLIRMAKTCRFGYVREILATCYIHSGSRAGSRPPQRRAQRVKNLFDLHHDFLCQHKKAYARLAFLLAVYKLQVPDGRRDARHYFWQSVRLFPFSIKRICYLGASCLPSLVGDPVYRTFTGKLRSG